jgi:hypothetical protein
MRGRSIGRYLTLDACAKRNHRKVPAKYSRRVLQLFVIASAYYASARLSNFTRSTRSDAVTSWMLSRDRNGGRKRWTNEFACSGLLIWRAILARNSEDTCPFTRQAVSDQEEHFLHSFNKDIRKRESRKAKKCVPVGEKTVRS